MRFEEDFRYYVLFIIIVSSIVLSGSTLELFGVPYTSVGGHPIFKIHIYSYLLLSVCCYIFLFRPNLIINKIKEYDLGLSLFAYGMSVSILLIFGLIKYGSGGMAFAIDTLASAWFVSILVLTLKQHQAQRMLRLIILLLTVCAVMILVEKLMGNYIIYSEIRFHNYFRPKGFFNHPLAAALVLASVLPLIFSVVNVSNFKGAVVVSLWIVAIFATGSRTASMITLIILFFSIVLKSIKNWPEITFGQCWVKKSTVKAIGLYSVAFLLLVMVFVFSGIADRIINEFTVGGSAMARFGLIDLLFAANSEELLFGSIDFIENSLEYYTGVNVLENYLVAWILSYGLLVAVPLYVAMIFFIYSIAKRAGFFPLAAALIFILVSASNNSLVTKSPAFLIFVSILMLRMVANRKPHEKNDIFYEIHS